MESMGGLGPAGTCVCSFLITGLRIPLNTHTVPDSVHVSRGQNHDSGYMIEIYSLDLGDQREILWIMSQEQIVSKLQETVPRFEKVWEPMALVPLYPGQICLHSSLSLFLLLSMTLLLLSLSSQQDSFGDIIY